MKCFAAVALLLLVGSPSVALAHASPSRPTHLTRLLCSFRFPVCLHGEAASEPAEAKRALQLVEYSFDSLHILGLPTGLTDRGQGGSWHHDVYLTDSVAGATSHPDPRGPDGHFDKSSSFTLLKRPLAKDCRGQSEVTRAVAQAALLRLEPAGSEGVLAMGSSYIASLLAPCASTEVPAIADFQRRPDRAITSGSRHAFAGSMLFPAFLDHHYGKDTPAGVWTSLYAFSAQATPPGEFAWKNEPDFFDTLRLATEANRLNAGDLSLRFAAARALLTAPGPRSSIDSLPYVGELGNVRCDWRIPISSLPRRLAPSYPPQVTGAAYLQVDVPPGHTGGMRLTVDWEAGMLMRWAVVKRDAEGRELLRHTAPGIVGQNYVKLSVVKLDGVSSLLVIGTPTGSDNRDHPFDPDDGPPRRVSFVATLEHM